MHRDSLPCSGPSTSPYKELIGVQHTLTKEQNTSVQVAPIRCNKNIGQHVFRRKEGIIGMKPHQSQLLTLPSGEITKPASKEMAVVAMPTTAESLLVKSVDSKVTLCDSTDRDLTLCEPFGCEDGNGSGSDLDEVDNLKQICNIFQKELETIGSSHNQVLRENLKPADKTAGRRHNKKKGRRNKGRRK